MGAGSWEEMVAGAVGESRYLQEQLVEQLAGYNEVTEAARWALQYGLDEATLTPDVQEAVNQLRRCV